MTTPWTVDDFSASYDSAGQITELHWGEGQPVTGEMRSQLVDYLSGRRRRFDLPLAPKGTPFQQRVWQALMQVPYGETVTYSDLAQIVGTHPRAIGSAMGRNPIPVIIPCHRVVGKQGQLTGFSAPGGIRTKETLLAHEKSVKQEQ